jgi:hypothetical protein
MADKALFPAELWPALDGNKGKTTLKTTNGAMTKKAPRPGVEIPIDKTEAMMLRIQSLEDAEEGDEPDEDAAPEEEGKISLIYANL